MMNLLIASAHAQSAPAAAPQQAPWMSMVPFVLIFLVMYFLMIRPQKKKMQEEQEYINKLAQGDEVFTKSGILGKITGIADKIVTLELEGGARMKVLKSHIGGSAKAILNPEKK
jgi:preprotein translocase subunit YajC